MRAHRTLVLSTLAVVIVGAAMAAGQLIAGGDDGGGPLQRQFDGGRYGLCGPGEPGTRFSFGEHITNPAEREAAHIVLGFELLADAPMVW